MSTTSCPRKLRRTFARISKRGCYDNDYYGNRSGNKRDISEVFCHNCKVKGHYANKCPAKKPLPENTTTKWCSLHKTRSHSDNECMAQQATPHPTLFLHCQRPFPLPQRLVHLPSWQGHRFRPSRKAGYNCRSTTAVHLIWSTPR